jgi:adenylate cyclase
MMLSTSLIRITIAFAAIILSIFIEIYRPNFINQIDEQLRDIAIRTLADEYPETRIAVIDINEASIAEIGPWPWPRSKIADLLEILFDNYDVKGIGLDIIFPEPGDKDGDLRIEALARELPLTLAQVLDYSQRTQSLQSGELAGEIISPTQRLIQATGYLGNHAGLATARCIGNIGYIPDHDGVLRHLPLISGYRGSAYQHFSASMLQCVSPEMQFDDYGVSWRIPYHVSINSYLVVPASAVLNQAIPQSWLKDRHIIIGSSSLSLGDRVNTPLAVMSAGTLVHAASLSALLDIREGKLNKAWSGRTILILWTFASIFFAAIALPRFSAWGNLFFLSLLSAVWLGICALGFSKQVEWSATAPLWAYSCILIFGIPNEWWRSQIKARQILDTFSHYVAKPVLDEIIRRGLTASLTPTLKTVTVLIADMEGYTEATSRLSLDEAAGLTKDFLDCLTRPVLSHAGTLDKYSGDGLVAFWGAPLPCEDQADKAVEAALSILAEVKLLNESRRPKSLASVKVRIGIESGKALVGDLGTSFRSTYTAVGDCINFASRLESAARDHGTPLLIGPVANNALERFSTYRVGTIHLRGTDTSIDVFSLDFALFTTENSELYLRR